MSKFRKNGKKEMKAISTASLPDIVFMLLFFFMVTTVMRETTLLVELKLPAATEIKKMEKKSLVSYIYVGRPIKSIRESDNVNPIIQLNDTRADINDIQTFIANERDAKDEKEIPYMTVSIKADVGNNDEDAGSLRRPGVKMKQITDIKQELRKANALKINYSTRKTSKKQDS